MKSQPLDKEVKFPVISFLTPGQNVGTLKKLNVVGSKIFCLDALVIHSAFKLNLQA